MLDKKRLINFCFLSFLTLLHITSFTFTFSYGVKLLKNGVEFNKVFQTTPYAILLVALGILMTPLGYFVLFFVTPLRRRLGLMIYIGFISVVFLFVQYYHFEVLENSLKPFDLNVAPRNDVDERLMTFILETYVNCCDDIDPNDVFCSNVEPEFPCLFEGKLNLNDVDDETCMSLKREARDSFSQGVKKFSNTLLEIWTEAQSNLEETL